MMLDEDALDDLARAILSDLCEGDGEHTEALDVNLIKSRLRAHSTDGHPSGSVTRLRELANYWPWVRRMYHAGSTKPCRRWFWTPITYRFGHGGWIYLDARWLWRFRNGA